MNLFFKLLFIPAIFICCLLSNPVSAQVFKNGKLYLNEDGSEYVRLTLLNQFWVRYGDYNPGSTLYDEPKSSGFDFGIRRFRVQMIARLSPRVFIYSQFGMNNFNFISDRKAEFFVHDALAEFTIINEKLSVGGGLTGWMNFSRYSSPTIGSVLGLDVPLYQQATVDRTDQFLRRLSVFAKGRLGRFDYHFGMAQPFAIQTSSGWDPQIGTIPNFSGKPPKFQYATYVTWQFAEPESMQLPFRVGSYLGTKEVFNIGAGLIYQQDAMWYREMLSLDTLQADMLHFAVDVFYDKTIGNKGESLTVYGNFTRFDFGPRYFRNAAIMNPVNGTNNQALLNGSGIGYPALGTGNVVYVQGGYKMSDDMLGIGTFLPYLAVQYADYERLNDEMLWYEAGLNWLINGHHSKFTLAYRNRPLFNTEGVFTERKGSLILQYQIFFY